MNSSSWTSRQRQLVKAVVVLIHTVLTVGLPAGDVRNFKNRQFFSIFTWKCTSRHSGVDFWTSELQKVLRDRQFLNILTWNCTWRHRGVQFFDIGTSKSALRMSVFLAFWLRNVLLATTACNFSTAELQKVL